MTREPKSKETRTQSQRTNTSLFIFIKEENGLTQTQSHPHHKHVPGPRTPLLYVRSVSDTAKHGDTQRTYCTSAEGWIDLLAQRDGAMGGEERMRMKKRRESRSQLGVRIDEGSFHLGQNQMQQ